MKKDKINPNIFNDVKFFSLAEGGATCYLGDSCCQRMYPIGSNVNLEYRVMGAE